MARQIILASVGVALLCSGSRSGGLDADERPLPPRPVRVNALPGDLPVELVRVEIVELTYLDATGRPPQEPYVLESNQPFELIVRFRVAAPAGERARGGATVLFIDDRPDGRPVICQSAGVIPAYLEDGTYLLHVQPSPVRRRGTLRVQIRGANFRPPDHSVSFLPP